MLLEDAVSLEEGVLRHTASDLDALLDRFRAAVGKQQRAFEEYRVLLAHAVEGITIELGHRLTRLTSEPPASALERLDKIDASTSVRDLESALRNAVEELAREEFEQVRRAEAARRRTLGGRRRPSSAAGRSSGSTRSADGRGHLRPAAERTPRARGVGGAEPFFYLFLQIESVNEAITGGSASCCPTACSVAG
ncbi:MAG: hypothetical protein ACRDJ4_14490 [Actinomycetota bacterium]